MRNPAPFACSCFPGLSCCYKLQAGEWQLHLPKLSCKRVPESVIHSRTKACSNSRLKLLEVWQTISRVCLTDVWQTISRVRLTDGREHCVVEFSAQTRLASTLKQTACWMGVPGPTRTDTNRWPHAAPTFPTL